MNLLALSTTTPRGSAAVLVPGRPPAAATYVDLQGHAERIFEAIDAALAEVGLDRSALTALACDIGPGSFTGVRVGVASSKGIALALGLPLVGVVSLEAMAAAAFGGGGAGPGDVVLAAIDARKNEVFRAAYRLGASGSLVVMRAPETIACGPAALMLPGIEAPLALVGEVLAAIAPGDARVLRGLALDLPDAGWVARLGAASLGAGDHGDPALVEPLYVRDADAQPQPGPTRGDPSADNG